MKINLIRDVLLGASILLALPLNAQVHQHDEQQNESTHNAVVDDHQEDDHQEDDHQDDDHQEDDHQEDAHQEDAHQEDDHQEYDHQDDDHQEDDHQGDDHQDDDHQEDDHQEGGHQEDEQAQAIKLNLAQLALADIRVETLSAKVMDANFYAPAEVKANGYTSYLVSPRVDSVVVKRHVSLGQHINKGQALVTLFSETIAQAQADYRIDFAEWARIKNLSSDTVSVKQKSEAQTRYIAAQAYLKAYGLTDKAIVQLVKDNSSPLGQYTLQAEQAGSVISDDFQQGQRVEAGEALITLVDESELWIEARLSPNASIALTTGAKALFNIANKSYAAKVIQQAHTIDPQTRTRIVRLAVKNTDHQLHPGMFGDVIFSIRSSEPVVAVPESALMGSPDGDWVVFVEVEPGEFQSVEVTLGQLFGSFREISGVALGNRVVVQGAFFVASEQAKSGFNPHNH